MALTTIPSGGKLRASIFSALITELRPSYVRKSTDETVSNSTTLQNDDELVLSVAANYVYHYLLVAIYGAGTTADYKWALTYPSDATLVLTAEQWSTAATPVKNQATDPAYTTGTALASGGWGVSSYVQILAYGILVMGSTAGSLQYQWAQNSAVVENTVTKAGSYMLLNRLA